MSNPLRFLLMSRWLLFLFVFSTVKAETTNPSLLAFFLENFVADIINLPINMSRTEIRAAKVAELYQRVKILNEYIALKTGIAMDETSMNEHEHDQQTMTSEKGDNYTCTNTKMHKLSEWADDTRVRTICGIGHMNQPMWIDQGQGIGQGQGLLTALTMFLLSNPTARLMVFMNDVFDQGTTPTSSTTTTTTPTSSTPTSSTTTTTATHGRMTPSIASLQRANAAVQVTPLVLPLVYFPLHI